jgi:large subunit ribosomal protein L13e
LPIETGTGVKFGVSDIKTGDIKKSDESVYAQLRRARSDARYVGVREKRAKAKAEAEESKKK